MASDPATAGQSSEDSIERPVRCVVGVLIGGDSKRMGRTKALLALPTGPTMVEHVVRVAQGSGLAAEETVLLDRPEAAARQSDAFPPALGDLRVLPDAAPDAGPLAGLCSLLTLAADRWAMLLSCDMPFLDTAVLRRLSEEARPGVDAVTFVQSDQPRRYHACCALYHPRVTHVAEKELRQGGRSLQHVLAAVRTFALRPTCEEALRLTNVNTPAEFEQASRRLEAHMHASQ